MSYRIMHLTGGFRDFLYLLEKEIPEKERTYDRLFTSFVDSRVGWSDYWIREFRRYGHEAELIVCNSKTMQKAWAIEHSLKFDEAQWAEQILLYQLKTWKPNIILIQDLYFVSTDLRRAIRNLLPDAILLGWRFAPTRDKDTLRDLDMLLTGAEAYAREFRKCGIWTEVVPLFFPEAVLEKVTPVKDRSLPFIFCGTLGKADGYHSQRYQTIEKLLIQTPLQVYTREYSRKSLSSRFGSLLSVLPGVLKDDLCARLRNHISLQSLYPRQFHEAVFGLEYFRLLAETQLCLNAHIDMAVGFAGNMRLFEATGMGACLLTDWKPNIEEFFEPEYEVVVYKTQEEAEEKAKYLLAHPKERESIAECGRRRTLRDHTLNARMPKLNDAVTQVVQRRWRT